MAGMRTTFGGYLGPDIFGDATPLPAEGVLLSTGRACIAAAVRAERPQRLWVPHYICDSVIDPDTVGDVQLAHYTIGNDLLPDRPPSPEADDMILLVNYFGLLTEQLRPWAEVWRERCIMDHSQAFFAGPTAGGWTFNSARKFFGVADGALLFPPSEPVVPTERNTTPITTHLFLALAGEQGMGLAWHRSNEASMSAAFRGCAVESEVMLLHTDRDRVRRARTENFLRLHRQLADRNELRMHTTAVEGPFAYPLLLPVPIDHGVLHRSGIFAPVLWPEVLSRPQVPAFERSLVQRLVALPVDQRYDPTDMDRMVDRLIGILDHQG